ncbi:MAG: FAD-dependent oxidoreductase, partial [Thermomicrobium sp.]|nr:FAD-dependent oxidoreductase [Thermomicrobium sp.]
MTGERTWDAVVVGSGPNGLAAALTLAAAGRSVLVLEAQDQLGGGLRTEPGIVPGLLHDHCATVLALVPVSPFFRTSGLLNRLAFVQPAAALAHPLDDGSAVLLWPELERTAAGLASDAEAYRRAMRPLLDEGLPLLAALLSPAPGMTRVPGSRVPWSALLRFALLGLQPATRLFARFRTERARALLAGLAAHSTLPLDWAPSAAFAVVLALCAHLAGWPLARGGSGSLAASMADALLARGGALRCGSPVRRLEDLPPARAIL